MTDARHFLGMEQMGDPLHWRLEVVPELTTPGNFLFGGCGLGASLVALESAAERPTVWATAQYLSYAPTHSLLDLTVTLAAEGSRVTQARAVGRVGDAEILTVNAALGAPDPLGAEGVWEHPPDVPPPEECPPRRLPDFFSTSIFDQIDVRLARGNTLEDLVAGPSAPGEPTSALWARVPGHLEPSAATLAILGDYVSGGVSQPLGRRTMSRSLDNTLRVVRIVPTEWVLCDIHIQAATAGYAQGTAYLWSRDGVLLATASQSMRLRFWPDERPGGALRSAVPEVRSGGAGSGGTMKTGSGRP